MALLDAVHTDGVAVCRVTGVTPRRGREDKHEEGVNSADIPKASIRKQRETGYL